LVLTPQALANCSPAVGAQRQPWVIVSKSISTLKGLFLHTPNAFSVNSSLYVVTQGCRYAPTAGLQLANAFGVKTKSAN
jgi:hypothetical protein